METAGLVIGVAGLAGLFSTCLEVLDKVQAYQTSAIDLDVLAALFNATKVLFERWGTSVGIDKSRLLPEHHPVLDNKDATETVAHVLHIIIKTICDASNVRPDGGRAVGLGDDDSSGLTRPKSRYVLKPEAIPRRLAWVLWRKNLRVGQVELFEMMVHKLRELVPPDTEETAWRARNPPPLGMDADICMKLSSDRRQTP